MIYLPFLQLDLKSRSQKQYIGGKNILVFTLSGAVKFNFRKRKDYYHYIEDRSESAFTKKFRKVENPENRIMLIPYTTI